MKENVEKPFFSSLYDQQIWMDKDKFNIKFSFKLFLDHQISSFENEASFVIDLLSLSLSALMLGHTKFRFDVKSNLLVSMGPFKYLHHLVCFT